MMKGCSVTFADCVAVWAAADAAAVLVDVLVLSGVVAAAVLAAVTVWNAGVELPAAAAALATTVAMAACFAVERVCGSAAELVHVAE